VRRVSGPSFLGLSDDTNTSVSYLLEDDLEESHWGRSVVLLLVLIGIGVAGWHWREQLRTYAAAHLAQHPNTPTEQVSTAEAPGSEIGAGAPNSGTATDKPMTGVGDLPVSTAQNPGAPGAEPNNVAPPPAIPNAALIQGTSVSPAQDGTAPAGNAAKAAVSAATSAPAPSTTPGSATPSSSKPAGSAGQNGSEEAASARPGSPASATASRKSIARLKQTAPAVSDADQLEAQGEKYLYGTGVPASCSLAQKDLQAAAEHGNAKANSVLGTMYATGHCVGRDLPLAYRWFAKALQQDPNNDRLARDLQVLWNQMTAEERQIAMRR